MPKTIHLVFKTHLDIGFTDHAARVRAQYHERYIPQAIDTAEHFFAEDPQNPRFIWTTGAWLIWDHLNSQDAAKVKRLEQAIERGLIRWHGLPFTTHSELMSPALFRAGLSYSHELDQRFGKETIAAKMTDVPGHTIGIVPLMAEAGLKFLHLGVNAASQVPDVPDVFRWRAPDGGELVVMYQKSYGETHFPDGFETGLSFAHTNDNMGPQSVPQTAEVYRHMQASYPDSTIRASTLEDYGQLLWERRAEFPVFGLEIGDSWIHGAASDPDKIARFRALQRLYDGFEQEGLTPARLAFGRGLAMVAEHTWGVDIKSYLRDENAWERMAFEAARKTDYRFTYAEASWTEQRDYLEAAVANLDRADRVRAEATAAADAISTDLKGWVVETDPATGDVAAIRSPSGKKLRGENGSLLGYRYESYDATDFRKHGDTYMSARLDWALLDFGKPGLENASTARTAAWAPTSRDGELLLDADAHALLGAPRSVAYRFRPIDANRIELTVELIDKPANRMPEASFVTFTPAGRHSWQMLKMAQWLSPSEVADRGGGQLQAVSAVRTEGIKLEPLDTPLVGPVDQAFMPFHPEPSDYSAGLRFNLHNNKWGTNFPMWWGAERFVARFVLTL